MRSSLKLDDMPLSSILIASEAPMRSSLYIDELIIFRQSFHYQRILYVVNVLLEFLLLRLELQLTSSLGEIVCCVDGVWQMWDF